ncbi:hypothetical protein G6F41_013764 [Rhizopus arrhizus]|nr:hypothetical protein G6F41_013764 [Rhizopus arrhizus]
MFFDQYLKPLIREAILKSCSKDFVCSGSDVSDPSVPSKKKADFMLGYKDRKREVFLFYVELKRHDKASKYQVEDDFVKLCKHMKYSIDNQAAIGIEAPVALGLWFCLFPAEDDTGRRGCLFASGFKKVQTPRV